MPLTLVADAVVVCHVNERVGVTCATRIRITTLTAPVEAGKRLWPLAAQVLVAAVVSVVVTRVQITRPIITRPAGQAVWRRASATRDALTTNKVEIAFASSADDVAVGSFAFLAVGRAFQRVVRITVVGRAVTIRVSHRLTYVDRLACRLCI